MVHSTYNIHTNCKCIYPSQNSIESIEACIFYGPSFYIIRMLAILSFGVVKVEKAFSVRGQVLQLLPNVVGVSYLGEYTFATPFHLPKVSFLTYFLYPRTISLQLARCFVRLCYLPTQVSIPATAPKGEFFCSNRNDKTSAGLKT